jgi:hypothetical protein
MASRVLQEEFARITAERLWVPVRSSNLQDVYWVPGGTGNLWIRFVPKPGAKYTVYVYQYVPESVYRGLLDAPSKGSYHWKHVRSTYAVIPVI